MTNLSEESYYQNLRLSDQKKLKLCGKSTWFGLAILVLSLCLVFIFPDHISAEDSMKPLGVLMIVGVMVGAFMLVWGIVFRFVYKGNLKDSEAYFREADFSREADDEISNL